MNKAVSHTTFKPSPASAPTMASLTRAALADNDNDTAKATEALTARLLSDAPLLRMVIEGAIRDATYSRVQEGIRQGRQSLLRAVANPPALDGASVLSVIRRDLLDFSLAGGLRLGDARKADVLAQVARYSSQADDMSHKARWLQRVADAMPAKKKVGDVLSADRLQKLLEESRS